MKSIMISIKPKYVADILNGKKTIEIRKSMPKCDFPIDVYIYCTKDKDVLYENVLTNNFYLNLHNPAVGVEKRNGKVVAKFTLNKVEEIICRPICGEWESYMKTLGYSEIAQASCLKNKEIVHYLKGKNGYAWHISNLEIFDKPKELSEFRKCYRSKGYPRNQSWYLTKAPESYCYVEELE